MSMNTDFVKKILFLGANPRDTTRLRLDQELRDIEEALLRAAQRERFELKQKWAVTHQTVQRAILELSPQIVHFSGHGMGTELEDSGTAESRKAVVVSEPSSSEPEGLVFEDEVGQGKLVPTAAIATLFKLFAQQPDPVECVLLNACYSEAQARAIVQHVPYVIGMRREIGDKAACEFAVGFYDALGNGRSIEFAFDYARTSIIMAGIPESLTPVLLRQQDLINPDPAPGKSDFAVVETNGRFYITRPQLEQRCYQEMLKPGMLIRIKSPDKMGKSLMMSRMLAKVSQNHYRTAIIDLREANQAFFEDINQFLLWFCAYLSDQLNVDANPDENWKTYLGANPNCTKYIEKHLLASAESPLVIAIDNFDCVFDHANIEVDFCGLLRGWFEKVNTNPVWGKLRQIIVYSQESYATKDINQSPFNVGYPVELGELKAAEVLALAKVYGLPWSERETQALMAMVGGHPYLVQTAMAEILGQGQTLEQILAIAATEEGIYGDYLSERLQRLEETPSLLAAMRQVVNVDAPVRLGSKETFKLDSMGLVRRQRSDCVPRCRLYQLYFRDRLGS